MVSIGALLVFPLTMAYVIVVHRAMDVRVVLRQGLQYLLATGSIGVLQIIISVAIIVAAVSTSVQIRAFRGACPSYPLVCCCLPSSADSAQRLRAWIDRRFFREAHSAELILNELNERPHHCRESPAP